MLWIANAELVAAVSNAGAFGIISASAGAQITTNQVENLRDQIRKAKKLTDKPFGVNLPIRSASEDLIAVIAEEGVPAVITAAGNPALYTTRFKQLGIKVLHLVSSVKQAKSAEAAGVDAVIAKGYEAGGVNGTDELTILVLVPQVADAVKIPVVASGGIADARGFVAALALGAEGVQMGTVFITTNECIAHPSYKEAIVKAGDTDTIVLGRRTYPRRGLKTDLSLKLLEEENLHPSEELSFDREAMRSAHLEGDLNRGVPGCGSVAGMIREIVGAGTIVQRIMDGIPDITRRLQ